MYRQMKPFALWMNNLGSYFFKGLNAFRLNWFAGYDGGTCITGESFVHVVANQDASKVTNRFKRLLPLCGVRSGSGVDGLFVILGVAFTAPPPSCLGYSPLDHVVSPTFPTGTAPPNSFVAPDCKRPTHARLSCTALTSRSSCLFDMHVCVVSYCHPCESTLPLPLLPGCCCCPRQGLPPVSPMWLFLPSRFKSPVPPQSMHFACDHASRSAFDRTPCPACRRFCSQNGKENYEQRCRKGYSFDGLRSTPTLRPNTGL